MTGPAKSMVKSKQRNGSPDPQAGKRGHYFPKSIFSPFRLIGL